MTTKADLRAQIRDLLEEREELLTAIRRLRMGNHPARAEVGGRRGPRPARGAGGTRRRTRGGWERVKCELCGDEWPDEEGGLESAVDHIRVMHPDKYDEPERWPDGGLVLHDDDPEPSDFTEEKP